MEKLLDQIELTKLLCNAYIDQSGKCLLDNTECKFECALAKKAKLLYNLFSDSKNTMIEQFLHELFNYLDVETQTKITKAISDHNLIKVGLEK